MPTDNLETLFFDSDYEKECCKNKERSVKRKCLIKKRQYPRKSHHREVVDYSNSLEESKIITTQESN